MRTFETLSVVATVRVTVHGYHNPRGIEGVFNDSEITQLIAVLTLVREHAAV
jgi:hypothetical protein